jgi:hypothetical protein
VEVFASLESGIGNDSELAKLAESSEFGKQLERIWEIMWRRPAENTPGTFMSLSTFSPDGMNKTAFRGHVFGRTGVSQNSSELIHSDFGHCQYPKGAEPHRR